MCISCRLLCLSVMLANLAWNAMLAVAEVGEGITKIPLRLEIELDSERCKVMQNFTLNVRVKNPNEYSVTLPWFELGYIEPEIIARGEDGETTRIFLGDTTRLQKTMTIDAGGQLEFHRFVFDSTMMPRWPSKPGRYWLQGKPPVNTGAIAPNAAQISLQWECPEVVLDVELTHEIDEEAARFLSTKLGDFDALSDPNKPSPTRFRIGIFSDFLSRYGNSAYAPEIRWELARLLLRELNDRQSPLSSDEKMHKLWSSNLAYCLNQGGAFAEEFTRWSADRGGSQAMEIALKLGDDGLARQISDAIDARLPSDQAAILFRRALVQAASGNVDGVAETTRELSSRFPESRYAKDVSSALEYLKQRNKRSGGQLRDR